MKIIWVSPEGNDTTGLGTQTAPYLTIERSLLDFVSGDQIRLLPGVYTPTDSIVISGVEGSLFSEDPRGAYIQPTKVRAHQACLAILDSYRFDVTGININQATDTTGNNIGIYAENVQHLKIYTVGISNFDIPSGTGYGIFASGYGRVEGCKIDNFVCSGPELYGVRTFGVDVIDCTVTAMSGDPNICDVYGISEEDELPTTAPIVWVGSSIKTWDGNKLTTQVGTTSYTIRSIYAVSSTFAFAAGNVTGADTPVILRYDGVTWVSDPLPVEPVTPIVSVWAVNAGEAYATTDAGVILYWNGVLWSTVYVAVAGNVANGVHSPSHNYAAFVGYWDSGAGVFAQAGYWDGVGVNLLGNWFVAAATEYRAYGIWSFSVNSSWVVGDKVSDDTGMIWYTDGVNVTQNTATAAALRDIWAFSATDIWAVGDASQVYRYRGATWDAVTFPFAGWNLSKVWGFDNKLWVVGEKSGVYSLFYYDGSSWYSEYSSEEPIYCVHVM